MSRNIKLLDKYDAVIIEERYNELIGRREVRLKILHISEGTLSRGLLKQGLAKLYNKEPGLVFIRKAGSKCGFPETIVEAHIYDNIDRARAFEPQYIIKRDERSLQKMSM
ncbi:MAG: 30S ribosomal protein S24e [Desulfurococcaceae archaeon]